MELVQIRNKLKSLENKQRAEKSKSYLKSQYSFYGISVPELRKLAKECKLDFYNALNLFDELWNSGNHEEMSLALFIIGKYAKKYPLEVWKFLTTRLEKAKSWDHIDELSCHTLGEILANNITLTSEIKKMSESKNPWIRRTSIVSCYPLIKKQKLELIFLLAEKLVYDNDIYVQKGAGWMLREAGKRNRLALREFIMIHLNMKPMAFSYATEKMPELRKIKKEKQKPYFIIIRGPAASGKTTIAKELAKKIKAEVFHFDKIMKKLKLDYILGDKWIPLEKFKKADEIMIPKFKEKLEKRKKIIIDGNFYHKEQIEDLIKNLNFQGFIFTLKANVDECIERDKTRKGIGEKAVKDVHNLVSQFDCGKIIDTNKKSINQILSEIISELPK